MRPAILNLTVAAMCAQPLLAHDSGSPLMWNATITAFPEIRVGHETLTGRPTGCTVVLAERGVTAGVDVRGAAPGTRETDVLNPVNSVEQIHAVVLSGGSAFGLDAASGVMRYLDERNVGFKVGTINVPIVPAAVLIDLAVGDDHTIRPTADCGYRAARAASDAPVAEGNVGAGAGATIGKSAGPERAMKGGIGSALIVRADGLMVGALVAANAYGDVVDPATGEVVAGVRTADGAGLADARLLLRDGHVRRAFGENTTLGVVVTNAALTKTQAARVAQMAHDGYARAIYPVHTAYDGDTIFALATGSHAGDADLTVIGALAADAVSDAILRAVRAAASIPGCPGLADWRR